MKSKELQSTPYGFIDTSRTLRKLSEVCVPKDGIQTGPFGSQLHSSDYVADGTPIITVEHLGENIIEGKKPPLVNAEDVKRLIKYTLKEGDIVFSRVGSVDRRALVSKAQNGWMFSGRLLRVRPEPLLADPRYLSYFFGLPMFKTYIRSIAVGATMPSLNTGLLSGIPVILPPISEQRAIGNVLSALDEKIRINNALSRTLEDIAQTIFKSWFIDFDPVKAKMTGEKPAGMDTATAALFPDSMEESELGFIPKGWSWISVGEIASVIDCLHSKKPELLEEGFPYLQLDTISDSGVLHFENAGLISKEDYDKWTSRIEVQGGDCLITNVGRVGAVSQVPDHFKAAIGRNITALRPKDSRLHRSFLIIALLSDFMKKEIKRNTDSGTILEALNVKNIPKLIIPGPSNSVLKEFAKLCDPIQLQLHELHEMNVNLMRIRDSLLPRLISGELQIPDEMLAS